MKLAAQTVAPLPSSSISKMEDRKRPAAHSADDLAPPTKRQATNGSKASADSDLPWKDDLEYYQKDAIYRQMLDYKREKAIIESQLRDVQKRSTDHDDHLRVIDAWWSQLLDEVRLLSGTANPDSLTAEVTFPTATDFSDSDVFSHHLESKAKEIKKSVSEILANITASSDKPSLDVQELRASLNKLLAWQKDHMVQFDRLKTEKEQLVENLETASLRYLKAEKKADRAKSVAVARVEQQAIRSSSNDAGSGIGGPENGSSTEAMNGVQHDDGSSQSALKEANAVLAKQKEQLDTLLTENKTLTEKLTELNVKLSGLTDDDYAKTELFKQIRTQHEDVIKRINTLEATNIQLREEAERLQAERTAYHNQVDAEAEVVTSELETQNAQLSQDLNRIRGVRDELQAEVLILKAAQTQERHATDHMKELVSSMQHDISTLDSEVKGLKAELKPGDKPGDPPAVPPGIDSLGLEELRQRYAVLEQNFESVNKELPGMEKAYRKATLLASKKVLDFEALETKVSMLLAEKTKADQKYFAARKDMENRLAETRSLKTQNGRSSEIITQLKDTSDAQRALISNLEKQLSELKHANERAVAEQKKAETLASIHTSKVEDYKKQVANLELELKSKDSGNAAAKAHSQSVERELERLLVKLEETKKEKESYRMKSQQNSSQEEEALRHIALCPICRSNLKNTTLKTCGHVFCNKCIDDRISNRMRKCPSCAKSFDKMDLMAVHL